MTSKPAGSDSFFLKKICIEGSGKGRIELLKNKQTFSYESEVDRKKNKFNLVLDFPVVGEQRVEFSLDPRVANQEIKNSEITNLLSEELKGRADSRQIKKAVEEFFVFTSDFMRFRLAGVVPPHFLVSHSNGHFILERSTSSYLFVVDNFSLNEKFFERLVLKIYAKKILNDPILTFFLVPESCDQP